MFAVFKTGGKQYKAVKGDKLKIDKIEGATGSVVVFDEVVLSADDKGKATVGAPLVKDSKVSAEILSQGKDDKILVFKNKRRSTYRRLQGHRQQITWIKIQDIGKDLKAKAAPAKKADAEVKAEQKPAAKKEDVKKAAPAKKTADKKPEAEKKSSESKKAAPKKPAAKKTDTKK